MSGERTRVQVDGVGLTLSNLGKVMYPRHGFTKGEVIDWTNPDTGSNGTISPLASARNEPDGRNCRAFSLTVSDVRGIRRYRGDACRAPDGMWQLFEVVPEDSALL